MTSSTEIITLPSLSDNYIYLIVTESAAIAIDPGDEGPVLTCCAERNLTLSAVLLTHHHADHTGGAAPLKAQTGCVVVGPDDRRIRGLDRTMGDGEEIRVGTVTLRAIATPGHTSSDLTYYDADAHALFTGDTLFCAGCGRIFEGSPRQMWESVQRIAGFPDNARVFCAHEYTEENLRFARSVDLNNEAIDRRLQEVGTRIAAGTPTVPSTLAVEKMTNPFLRVHERGIRQALGMATAADHEVFGEMRRRKNSF